jgi:hypothetical protein|tara:strand:+ start:419 stop:733 length:315 start_codon:yes stop_codon:yes gene_type:complete
MEYFKKFGWVLLAGLISFVIFVILLFGLSAVVEYFREQQMLEPRLFFDSFLKPVALIFFSSWAWLAGIFLSKDGPKRWGRRGIYVYIAVAILPYISSFFVTSGS